MLELLASAEKNAKAVEVVKLCPSCNAEMKSQTVTCTSCGYNRRTKKKAAPPTAAPVQAKHSRSMPSAVPSFPPWMISVIILGGLGFGAIFRGPDDILFALAMTVCALGALTSYIAIIVIAFKSSALRGILCIFIQIYALYFAAKHVENEYVKHTFFSFMIMNFIFVMFMDMQSEADRLSDVGGSQETAMILILPDKHLVATLDEDIAMFGP